MYMCVCMCGRAGGGGGGGGTHPSSWRECCNRCADRRDHLERDAPAHQLGRRCVLLLVPVAKLPVLCSRPPALSYSHGSRIDRAVPLQPRWLERRDALPILRSRAVARLSLTCRLFAAAGQAVGRTSSRNQRFFQRLNGSSFVFFSSNPSLKCRRSYARDRAVVQPKPVRRVRASP